MQKTVDGVVTDYTYSGNYVIEETDKTYLRGLSYHAIMQDNETYYYFCNAHGDTTGVADSNGSQEAMYDYDEFGNLTFEHGRFDNDLLYAGEFYDSESENYYLRSRYYDPTVGRFTQQDSFLGVDNNPLSLNRYTYCHNNPISYVDPSGFYRESSQYIGSYGEFVFDLDQLDTSDKDYYFFSYLSKVQKGDMSPEEFFKKASAMGVNVGVRGRGSSEYIEGYSDFIPPEALNFTGEKALLLRMELDAYEHGYVTKAELDAYIGMLSAEAVKREEVEEAGYNGYELTDIELYPAGEPPYYLVDGVKISPSAALPAECTTVFVEGMQLAKEISESNPMLGPEDAIAVAVVVGTVVVAGGTAVVVGAKNAYKSIASEDEAEETATSTDVTTKVEKRDPVVFPQSPMMFNPKGLTVQVLPGTKNGGFVIWKDVNDVAVFRWDENPEYSNGSHYHIINPNNTVNIKSHYYAGEKVPEPFSSIYF